MASLNQVIDGNYCVGCGACAVAQASPVTIAFDDEMRLQAKIAGEAPRELAKVCPFSGEGADEDAIAAPLYGATAKRDEAIGWYDGLYAGYATSGGFRKRGSSGGLAGWVATRLIERGAIDGVIHVRPAENDERLFRYAISRTADEIAAGSSSRYYPVEMSEAVRLAAETPGRYLFVGLPCFVKAFRLLVQNDARLQRSEFITLGIVCGHLKSTRFADTLAWEAGIGPGDLKAINFRVKLEGLDASSYGCRVSDGTQTIVRRKRGSAVGNWGLGFFKYGACEMCDDVFAETADIAVGDAWIQPYSDDSHGNSLVVTRLPAVQALIADGIADGSLHLDTLTPEQAVKSQASGVRYRRQGLSYRMLLKDRAGVWHPPKRVTASEAGLSDSLKRRYELRQEIAAESHAVFKTALMRRSLVPLRKQLAPLIAEHERLSMGLRRRFIESVKSALRPLYFRLRPPRPL
jgi:coenzyme F420-reducing hydrogenase beta subunit